MRKITSIFALIIALSMLIVSCAVEPEDNEWVADPGYTATGALPFTLFIYNAKLNGALYTGDAKIWSNILDSTGWSGDPVIVLNNGVGTYVDNAGTVSKGSTVEIAGVFAPKVGGGYVWDPTLKFTNSQGSSNWTCPSNGYKYEWDLSTDKGPLEKNPIKGITF